MPTKVIHIIALHRSVVGSELPCVFLLPSFRHRLTVTTRQTFAGKKKKKLSTNLMNSTKSLPSRANAVLNRFDDKRQTIKILIEVQGY